MRVPSALPSRRRLAKLAGLPLTFTLVAIWFCLLRPVTLGGTAGYVIVAGHSMEPAYWTGDLAITQRQTAYAIGDVIAFSTDGGVVIHRIVGGDAAGGYRTRGDNREAADIWQPRPDAVIGKVWLHVPAAGNLLAMARQPGVLAGTAAAVAFLLAFTAGPLRLPWRRAAQPSTAALATHRKDGAP